MEIFFFFFFDFPAHLKSNHGEMEHKTRNPTLHTIVDNTMSLQISNPKRTIGNNGVDIQSIKRELDKVKGQTYVGPWKQKKKEPKYKIPTLPEWIFSRPYMCASFLSESSISESLVWEY
jgi:hypothetical protein